MDLSRLAITIGKSPCHGLSNIGAALGNDVKTLWCWGRLIKPRNIVGGRRFGFSTIHCNIKSINQHKKIETRKQWYAQADSILLIVVLGLLITNTNALHFLRKHGPYEQWQKSGNGSRLTERNDARKRIGVDLAIPYLRQVEDRCVETDVVDTIIGSAGLTAPPRRAVEISIEPTSLLGRGIATVTIQFLLVLTIRRRREEWRIDVHQLNAMLGPETFVEITERTLQIIRGRTRRVEGKDPHLSNE